MSLCIKLHLGECITKTDMLSNPLSNQISFFPDCLLYVLVVSITSHTGCLEGPTSNRSYYVKFDAQLGSSPPGKNPC